MSATTTQQPASATITNSFAAYMQSATGYVSDELEATIASRRELDVMKSMLEGQPCTLCEKCGRPLRVSRQFKQWQEKENPEFSLTVPLGARRPEKFIREPRKTYGVYSFNCQGKDEGSDSKVSPSHAFVYKSFLDFFKFNREQLSPQFLKLLYNQEQNPQNPWLTFTPEELAAAERGEWTYLSTDTIDAINSRAQKA